MTLHDQCFFTNQTGNGTSSVEKSIGGMRQVVVSGTMGGATVTFEGSLDGTKWAPIKAITALGHYSFPFTKHQVRAVVSGATGSTDITVAAYEDPDVMVVFP